MRDWNDQNVVIVGAARQGIALTRYLVQQGAQVTINDQKPLEEIQDALDQLHDLVDLGFKINWVCGGHPLNLLDNLDVLCVSGGVPLNLPLIVDAEGRGIPVLNDSQIFMDVVPCKVVGITGSAGKTTTTTLVGSIAQEAVKNQQSQLFEKNVWIGGNIGAPLISFVEDMERDDLAVMELSSFQLEIMDRSPELAVVLNLTPNHLDRHGSMQSYTDAKTRILNYQAIDDIAILNRDDPIAWSLKIKVQGNLQTFGLSELPPAQGGTFIWDDVIYKRVFETNSEPDQGNQENKLAYATDSPILSRDEIHLPGEHNLLNIMAACTIASALNIPIESIRSGLKQVRSIPHRLEFIRWWGGAQWYNDSIATTPERAMAAIHSFDEPIVLLAGGRDKKLPWYDFADLVHKRVSHLILFGEAKEKITKALDMSVNEEFITTSCLDLQEAVQVAAKIIRPGDVVLLSPGGTSFDEFRDFEERGECFAKMVRDL
ncbi:UDP-N-acetylmuramoyl-L-alanine--D-glutamate ligase [Chloroflexota bacterium]